MRWAKLSSWIIKIIFTVTGIAKNLPNNTRFDFEYLIPWSYLRYRGDDDSSWGNNSTRTYVMLKPNATLASIAPKSKNTKNEICY